MACGMCFVSCFPLSSFQLEGERHLLSGMLSMHHVGDESQFSLRLSNKFNSLAIGFISLTHVGIIGLSVCKGGAGTIAIRQSKEALSFDLLLLNSLLHFVNVGHDVYSLN